MKYFFPVLFSLFLTGLGSCRKKMPDNEKDFSIDSSCFVFEKNYILDSAIPDIKISAIEKKWGGFPEINPADVSIAKPDSNQLLYLRSIEKYDKKYIPLYVKYTIVNHFVAKVKYEWASQAGLLDAFESRYDEVDSLLKIRYGKPDHAEDNFPRTDTMNGEVVEEMTTRIDFGFYSDWNKKPGKSPEVHLHFHESYRKGQSYIELEIIF